MSTLQLQERNSIAENAVRAAIAPEGVVGRSYSVERSQQDMRLSLMFLLAQNVPVGRRFASVLDLAMWAYEQLAKHPRGVDEDLRDRACYVVGIMWSAMEEAGGAREIVDHAAFLIDIAYRARRGFYREESAIRRAIRAVAV